MNEKSYLTLVSQ